MGERVNDKTIPGTTFPLNFQMTFNSSIPQSLNKKLHEHFGNKRTGRLVGISKRLKKDFLREFYDVSNEKELLSKNVNLRKKIIKEGKHEVIDEAGLEEGEFQTWLKNALIKYVEEVERKPINNK